MGEKVSKMVEDYKAVDFSNANDQMTAMTLEQLAGEITRICKLTGVFKLRSGKISNIYFDKYLFECDPILMKHITSYLSRLLPPAPCVLAGLEMGGIPIATYLSSAAGYPMVQVRKKAKEYGTCRLAEGRQSLKDDHLCIVEDVVSTGGQIIESAKELRKLGARVDTAMCVILRETKAVELLAAEGVKLIYLFVMTNEVLVPAVQA